MLKRVNAPILLAVTMLSASVACLGASEPAAARAPLVFRVSGTAKASPDSVTVRFAVVGDGDTLCAAQEQMQTVEKSVMSALEKQGGKAQER